ncbi:MAG: hypothetical protein AAFX99_36565, partial [Myxococcota bacterium]
MRSFFSPAQPESNHSSDLGVQPDHQREVAVRSVLPETRSAVPDHGLPAWRRGPRPVVLPHPCVEV